MLGIKSLRASCAVKRDGLCVLIFSDTLRTIGKQDLGWVQPNKTLAGSSTGGTRRAQKCLARFCAWGGRKTHSEAHQNRNQSNQNRKQGQGPDNPNDSETRQTQGEGQNPTTQSSRTRDEENVSGTSRDRSMANDRSAERRNMRSDRDQESLTRDSEIESDLDRQTDVDDIER